MVIPCYNSEGWIGRSIRSVLDQGYEGLTLIVVDDGSTDGSAAAVKGFGPRVILETGPNRGACHARNKGLARARQEGADYITFLDADDFLEAGLIAGGAEVAAEFRPDMVLSDMHTQDADGRRHERFLYSGQIAPETLFQGWLKGNFFIPGCILWRLDFVDGLGGWDESLSRYQDTDIAFRAMLQAPTIRKNGQGAAVYTKVNAASISKTASRAASESQMRVLIETLERVPGTPFEPYVPLLHRKLYDTARVAFRRHQTDLGRQALKELAGRGFREHPGNWQHRLLASLIGLEAKVRLRGR